MATVLLSPVLLPMLQRATETPPSEAVSAASPAPVEVVKSAPSPRNHELQIPDNGHGQYIVNAWVNGVSVRFLVDTGANIVSISTETANRLGFMDSASAPHYEVGTANGHTRAYGVKLRTVDLGPIYVGDVDATVKSGPRIDEPAGRKLSASPCRRRAARRTPDPASVSHFLRDPRAARRAASPSAEKESHVPEARAGPRPQYL